MRPAGRTKEKDAQVERLFTFEISNLGGVPLFPLFVVLAIRIISDIASGVFHLAPGILRATFDFVHRAFALRLRVASPFAGLPFCPSCDLVHLAFDSVLVHDCLLASVGELLLNCGFFSYPGSYRLKCGSSSGEQLEDQRDYRQHEQQMNESAERVAADNSDQPEHKQNDK